MISPSPQHRIDLNADLGEGGPHDAALLALVSSANLSCGVHAGDSATIEAAISHALRHQVRLGAHPSFPDREHGGRREMQLPFAALRASLLAQLDSLNTRIERAGGRLCYVKPHGALYNQAARDEALAEQVITILREFNPALAVMGLAGGKLLEEAAKAGMRGVAEAFADRRYDAQGQLVPRAHPRALIEDVQESIAQSLAIILKGTLPCITGEPITLTAQSLCLHGDTPQALHLATELVQALRIKGIPIGAPVA